MVPSPHLVEPVFNWRYISQSCCIARPTYRQAWYCSKSHDRDPTTRCTRVTSERNLLSEPFRRLTISGWFWIRFFVSDESSSQLSDSASDKSSDMAVKNPIIPKWPDLRWINSSYTNKTMTRYKPPIYPYEYESSTKQCLDVSLMINRLLSMSTIYLIIKLHRSLEAWFLAYRTSASNTQRI